MQNYKNRFIFLTPDEFLTCGIMQPESLKKIEDLLVVTDPQSIGLNTNTDRI